VQRGAAEASDSGKVQRMRAVGLTSILDRGQYLWLIPADADEPTSHRMLASLTTARDHARPMTDWVMTSLPVVPRDPVVMATSAWRVAPL